MKRHWKKLVFSSCSLIVLTGCSTPQDFAAVNTFAKVSDKLEASFPSIAEDLYGSCLRSARYAGTNLSRNGKGILEPRKEAEKKCNANFSGVGEGLSETNELLIGYMRGLGEIATDSTVTYTSNSDRIANGLTGAGLNSTQVKAGQSIFNTLLKAATEGYRRGQLKTLIVDYDKDVQSLTSGLKIIIGDKYLRTSLRAEKDQLDTYFEGYIEERAIAAKEKSAILPSEVLAIEGQWNTEQELLRARKEKTVLYVAILDKIATGHKQLYTLFSDSKTGTKTASCRINECESLTPETLMKAKEILAKTLEQIEPLANGL
jgi:hypothetical protein